jgi:hypothetical protein
MAVQRPATYIDTLARPPNTLPTLPVSLRAAAAGRFSLQKVRPLVLVSGALLLSTRGNKKTSAVFLNDVEEEEDESVPPPVSCFTMRLACYTVPLPMAVQGSG